MIHHQPGAKSIYMLYALQLKRRTTPGQRAACRLRVRTPFRVKECAVAREVRGECERGAGARAGAREGTACAQPGRAVSRQTVSLQWVPPRCGRQADARRQA